MQADETAIRREAVRCIALLDQAVARDPNFMLAYCDLAIQHDYAWTHSTGATTEELSVDHRTLAEVALQKARILQPDAGEMHLATARHLFFCHDTSGQAAIEAELARRALPNNAGAEHIAAEIACDAGRWDDAVRSYEHAIVLAPRDALCHIELAETLAAMRRYQDYDRVTAATIPLVPADERTELLLARAARPLEARADLAPLRTALAAVAGADDPGDARGELNLLLKICERDPDGIERALAADDEVAVVVSGFPYPKAWFRALAAKMRGDEAGARAALAAARPVMDKFVADKPRSGARLSLLAVIDAGLGRKEDAVREAQRACEMEPYGQGSMQAPTVFSNQAVVYAWIGQPDLAFQTLNEAVKHPAGGVLIMQPTYGDFRLDPIWDALRDDPRFEALVHRLAPDQNR